MPLIPNDDTNFWQNSPLKIDSKEGAQTSIHTVKIVHSNIDFSRQYAYTVLIRLNASALVYDLCEDACKQNGFRLELSIQIYDSMYVHLYD